MSNEEEKYFKRMKKVRMLGDLKPSLLLRNLILYHCAIKSLQVNEKELMVYKTLLSKLMFLNSNIIFFPFTILQCLCSVEVACLTRNQAVGVQSFLWELAKFVIFRKKIASGSISVINKALKMIAKQERLRVP